MKFHIGNYFWVLAAISAVLCVDSLHVLESYILDVKSRDNFGHICVTQRPSSTVLQLNFIDKFPNPEIIHRTLNVMDTNDARECE